MSPPPPPSLPSTNHIVARDRDRDRTDAQPSSRSQIAGLLTESYKEIEALRHSLAEEKRRADHWKSLAEAFDAASPNGSSQDLHDKIRALEQRAYSAECLRDEEMARRVAITDLWFQLRDYLSVLDAHSKDARVALDRSVDIVSKGVGGGALIRELPVIPVPSIGDIAGGEDKVYSSQGMLPPVGTHMLRKGQQTPGVGRVRPRSDSMEMGGHAAKKSRHESRPHRSHSRSSSHSSIDEMILQAADRDEGAMYTHPPPRRNGAGTGKLVPDGVLPQQQYQTHVFAPVVTGAPTKKGKYNPGSQVLETQQPSLTHSSHLSSHPASLSAHPSITVGIEQKIYPPTNEQGQRICRSCGQPGRYKEDKCVEKWGPGPMGPGTVCDRCRKKMKRFERRGTLGASQTLNPQLARNNLPQPQLHPSPSPSHPSNPMPRPSSSSSSSVHHSPTTHRASPSSVHRSDTIIVPSLPPIAVERDTPSVRRITPSHSNGSGKESDADADADGEVDEIDADGDIDMRETQVRTVGLDKSDKTDKDRAKSEDAVAAEPGEPEESVVDDLLEAVDAAEARG